MNTSIHFQHLTHGDAVATDVRIWPSEHLFAPLSTMARRVLAFPFRNDSFVGTEARGLAYTPGTFDTKQTGGWVGAPIAPLSETSPLLFVGSLPAGVSAGACWL